jgi:molybdopterin-containing oxidoreductase family membrane subunit
LSGLGSRPFWNTPILAPRFLISAGASAPALLIILFTAIKYFTKQRVKDSVFEYFLSVLRITMPINLFLVGCEVFQEFYTGSLHAASAYYLYFGLHGHSMLPKFIWTALAFNVTATVIFLVPKLRARKSLMYMACGLTVVGIWTEKGMGLIFPGFVPSPLGEIVEYAPNLGEILLNIGIVALGAFVYTMFAKVTIAIQNGELRLKPQGPGEVSTQAVPPPPPPEADEVPVGTPS